MITQEKIKSLIAQGEIRNTNVNMLFCAVVFREMKWAEELGSGKKNIKKFAPLYYDKYQIEIQNFEKFVFSISYRDEIVDSTEKEDIICPPQEGPEHAPSKPNESDQVIDQDKNTRKAGAKQEPSDGSQATDQVTDQVTDQATDQATDIETDKETDKVTDKETDKEAELVIKYNQILAYCSISRNLKDIMNYLGYRHKYFFLLNHIQPIIEKGMLAMVFPDKPKHRKQKYITTEKGKSLIQLKNLESAPEENIIFKEQRKEP